MFILDRKDEKRIRMDMNLSITSVCNTYVPIRYIHVDTLYFTVTCMRMYKYIYRMLLSIISASPAQVCGRNNYLRFFSNSFLLLVLCTI